MFVCARLSVAMAARVGGKKKYPGTAVITVSLASEDRYSICDYEASFTLATPSVSRRGGGAEDGDDTDVELEDSASKSCIRRFVITEKALVGAFSVITNLRICFGCIFLKH